MDEKNSRASWVDEIVGRNMALVSEMNEKMWNMMMATLGGFSWLNEQWEKIAQTYIEQRKNMRQEYVKLAEQITEKMRDNFKEVEGLVKETATATTKNIPSIPGFISYQELVKKVEELAKKVEEISSKEDTNSK